MVTKAQGLIWELEEPIGLGLAHSSGLLCIYTFVKSRCNKAVRRGCKEKVYSHRSQDIKGAALAMDP